MAAIWSTTNSVDVLRSTELDTTVVALLAELARTPALAPGSTPIQEARDGREALLARHGFPRRADVVARRVDVPADPPVRCRKHLPVAPVSGTIVYLHGGGWVYGSLEGSDGLCDTLADATGLTVVNVDYRLAPEHVYPAALDDVAAVVDWVLSKSPAPRPLVVVGDSAGANLVAAETLRRRGRPDQVDLQVLLFPPLDPAMDSASYRSYAEGHFLRAADMAWYWEQYVPDPSDREHAHAAPSRAIDLDGLPAAVVVVAGHDPLRDEGLEYARRLAESGVEVKVGNFADMIHSFIGIPGLIPQALSALAEIAGAITDRVRSAHDTC